MRQPITQAFAAAFITSDFFVSYFSVSTGLYQNISYMEQS